MDRNLPVCGPGLTRATSPIMVILKLTSSPEKFTSSSFFMNYWCWRSVGLPRLDIPVTGYPHTRIYSHMCKSWFLPDFAEVVWYSSKFVFNFHMVIVITNTDPFLSPWAVEISATESQCLLRLVYICSYDVWVVRWSCHWPNSRRNSYHNCMYTDTTRIILIRIHIVQ